MLTDFVAIRTDLDQKKVENLKFSEFLTRICEATPFYMGKSIHALAKAYGDVIDCTKCGRCCHDITIHINAEDRRRLAKWLKIPEDKFRDVYCKKTDMGWAFTDLQCPFLEEKRCLAYTERPFVCRQFPSQDLESICLNGTMTPGIVDIIKMAYRCPIYYNVLEELKTLTGFKKETGDSDPVSAAIEKTQPVIEEHNGNNGKVVNVKSPGVNVNA